MTVSVKAPTSTTGSIQLNGSDVLTIDSSGNLTAPNNLTVTGSVSGGSGLGKVLQVVQANWSGFTSTTATTWTATGLTTSITPSSTSSKILVFCHFSGCINVDDQTGYYTIFRNGATNLGSASYGLAILRGVSNAQDWATHTIHVLDSPSTTSSVDYKVYMAVAASGTLYAGSSANWNKITLMEIAG